jgi:hypothetical protein
MTKAQLSKRSVVGKNYNPHGLPLWAIPGVYRKEPQSLVPASRSNNTKIRSRRSPEQSPKVSSRSHEASRQTSAG